MVVCWVFYGGRIGHVILCVVFVVLVFGKGGRVLLLQAAHMQEDAAMPSD